MSLKSRIDKTRLKQFKIALLLMILLISCKPGLEPRSNEIQLLQAKVDSLEDIIKGAKIKHMFSSVAPICISEKDCYDIGDTAKYIVVLAGLDPYSFDKSIRDSLAVRSVHHPKIEISHDTFYHVSFVVESSKSDSIMGALFQDVEDLGTIELPFKMPINLRNGCN